MALEVSIAGMAELSSTNSSRPGFYYCAINSAAHNFTMPAMSPTMTEGNIASWKVKEGIQVHVVRCDESRLPMIAI